MLVNLHRVLGQVPYGWPSPNGYPWGSAAWGNAGAIITRWKGLVTLVHADRGGIRFDPAVTGAAGPVELVAVLCGPDHQVF